jgi:hypothetical protein
VFLVVLPACLCVLTRAFLNVCDRQIFKKASTDLFKSVVLNSVFPFLIALGVAYFFGQGERYFWEYLFDPGVLLSAAGAELAACILAFSFSKMLVKSVVVSVKMADLFIPLLLTCITSQFKLSEYIFSCLSVFIFIPILFPLKGAKSCMQLKMIAAIISVLVFQAGINSYFCLYKFAESLPSFLSLITCILFWRTVMILTPYIIRSLRSLNQKEIKQIKSINYALLFLRAIISFLSQAAFFYSITRTSSNLAWPILNTTPLVACFAAHFVLKEKVGKTEIGILVTFIMLAIFYGVVA